MKLIDAIRNVARPEAKHKWDFTAPTDPICESLSIQNVWDWPDEVEESLKAYPIYNWICTDESVGLDALYLKGEPVGCAYRSARKASYEIEWISEAHAERVRSFIMAHVEKPEFNIMNPDQEIGDDFNVNYVGQALTADGFYQGRPVRALVWYDGLMGRTTDPKYRRDGQPYTERVEYKDPKSNCVLVQDGDEQRVIPIEDFRLAFNVKMVD